jgi:hypothetical protein
MRRLFTADEAGLSRSALRCGEQHGQWRRLARGVYGEGAAPPSQLDLARASILVHGHVARDDLAGVLLGLDAVWLTNRPLRRYLPPPQRLIIVGGLPCGNGIQTLIDLADRLDDLRWEQAFESALRKRLTSVEEVVDALPALGRARIPGTTRIRRVLALREPGAPPTGSILETYAVQLVRDVPEIGPLTRQYVVHDQDGLFVAQLDLSRPEDGFFFELDGEQHKGQPVYDSLRETAVVATTGWLPGRFTWTEVTRCPVATKRRMLGVVVQARRRHAPTA